MGIIQRLRHYRRIVCAALLIQGAAGAFAYAIPAHAQEPTDVWIDELVLQVVMPPYRLSEAMIVVQQDSRFYVPIIEMAEMIDFVAEADQQRGMVNGWALTEENTYSIDVTRGELVHKGEKRSLSDDEVITIEEYQGAGDDIFIATEVIEQIWPVKMEVNFSELELQISSEEELPFEARLAREEKRELAAARKKYAPSRNKDLPMIENPYQILGLPAVDIDTSYTWDRETRLLTGQNALTGKMDLLGLSADFSATASYDEDGLHKPERIRLTGKRRAQGDDDLALGFKEMEVGDTRVAPRSLVGRSISGRGGVFSTREIDNLQVFDEITVEGQATPGWETELYRNNELLDFGTVDNTGEYRFENVQLMNGNNTIRVVLYGPQGQIDERSENYVIGGGMVRPGEFAYEIGAVDMDRDLIPIDQDPRTGPRGVASNSYVAYGVGTGLTVFGGATRLPVSLADGKFQNFVSGGAMFNLLGGLAQLELYKEMAGGHAVDARYVGEFLGVNVNAQHAMYREFESPDAGYGVSRKRTETDVGLNKNLRLPFGSLGLQLDVNHQELDNDRSTTRVSTRQSISKNGVRFTHQTNTSITDQQHDNSAGVLSVSTRVRKVNLRGNLNYDIYPEFRPSSVQADASYTSDDGFSVGGEISHDMVNSITGIGGRVGYDFGKFLASVDTDWLQERGVQVMLRASTSLAPYGADGGYMMSSDKLTAARPVRARIFLDNDGDNIFSEGDAPVQDARVQVGLRSSDDASGEDGYVLALQSGGTGGVSSVQVDKASLGDPFLVPGIEGYNTVPRAGSVVDVDLPVVETGAIDGTVTDAATGKGVGGMTLELVNDKGVVVMTTSTAYDGFYTFEYVRAGTYVVRADPSYGVNVPPASVTVAAEELFAYGMDMQLLPDDAPQGEAVAAAPVEPVEQTPEEGVEEVVAPAAAEEEKEGKAAPRSGEGTFSVIVKGVRIGEHPDRVRLVMDMSAPAPADYAVTVVEGGGAVQIDLPNVAWDAMAVWRSETTPVIASFSTEALPSGGTRVKIKGRALVTVGQKGRIGPADGLGDRLFVDVQGAAP